VGIVPIEYLATELQRKKDLKQFTFRDIGTVYVDYTHLFSTEILEDKIPEEAAKKRKRRRKPNIDEKEELEKIILKYFDEAQIVSKDSPFRVLQVNAKISEMREFLQQEREIALQLKIRDSALEEKEKARLRRLWGGYKNKIKALQKLRGELRGNPEKKGAIETIDALIEEYREKHDKPSYALANKIVTGHYTEMMRWESHHPWS